MAVTIRLFALVALVLNCTSSAQAENMRAIEAQEFISGNDFAYTCFDGTTGSGRIYADGSVAGYIRLGNSGPRRYIVLPAGTLRLYGERFCASLRGVSFEPCFNIERTSQISFRGSVSGLDFAYCTFTRLPTPSGKDFANYRLRGIISAGVD